MYPMKCVLCHSFMSDSLQPYVRFFSLSLFCQALECYPVILTKLLRLVC